MPKYVIVPPVMAYPAPPGMNPVTSEFSTLEEATAAATAALQISPTQVRVVAEVVSRLSATVAVASIALEVEAEEAPVSK